MSQELSSHPPCPPPAPTRSCTIITLPPLQIDSEQRDKTADKKAGPLPAAAALSAGYGLAADALPLTEATQLIASLIGTPDDTDIPALATLLGCLPLALVQASAYIRENGIAVTAYLNAYQAQAKHLLQQAAARADFPLHDPVFVTAAISLDAIANEEKAKGKQVSAKQLLQCCAFVGPQKISSHVVEEWHTQTYPAISEPFTEARSRLQAHSLIQLDPNDQSIQVHRLVQQVMREQLSAKAQTAQLQQTIELLIAAYPQEHVSVGKRWNVIRFGFIPHLEAVIAYHAHYKLAEDINLSMALTVLAAAYNCLGQAGKERELLEHALAIQQAHYGKDHYQVANTLVRLGTAYGSLGDIGKKRALLERALAIQQAHYGPEHYEVATTLRCLGTAYGDLGNVGKKRELLERALAIQQAHYGPEHYQVAIILVNLGNTYGTLGDVVKKRALLERALAIQQAHYGLEHYQVAITLVCLGNAHFTQGEMGKAQGLLERALVIQQAHYGKEHHQVAITLVNLGNAYGALGDVGKKRGLLERAFTIQQAYYGPKHYKVAKTLLSLGNTYGDLGDVGKKRELLERALAIQQAHYGPLHSELAITMTHLAVAYHKLQQPQAALQAAQRTYRILMSHPHHRVRHPKTKQCLKYLQSKCEFTLAMLQSNNAIAEEKQSTKSSRSITSPSPQKSQVANKTPSPLTNLSSSLTSYTSASLFSSTMQQLRLSNSSSTSSLEVIPEESEEDTALASH